ncbi:MAG: hypothetical protein ACD_62C00222G0006 [uncultured bacterium]|nr:MAG: hypothetical protein ACD_62C00222G0006 [uncultured bacterium]
MRSFEYDYLLETPISHSLLADMRVIGEFRGRQFLYTEQSPQILEALRRVAMIQSAESSNRIEGIEVLPERIGNLVEKKTRPRDRSEQEVAGYRDVLGSIHVNHKRLPLTNDLIRQWHKTMYHYTSERAGNWKKKDNAIFEVRPDGKQVVRFQPVAAISVTSFMNKLINLFDHMVDQKKTDPLLLIASFVLDFECIHPFTDGNGRLGRLLTQLLLYRCGYEVGRYISLERVVEDSKETYYEALFKSSQGWHEVKHDLRPWWSYFTGMLLAAYNEFESRVGTIISAKGAKREMVRRAINHLPQRFTIDDLRRACPGVSYPTLQRVLTDLKKQKNVECLGRGPDAEWNIRKRYP